MFSKQRPTASRAGLKYAVLFLAIVSLFGVSLSGDPILGSVFAYIAPTDEIDPARVDRPGIANHATITHWGDYLSMDAVSSDGIETNLDGNASALVASDQLLAALALPGTLRDLDDAQGAGAEDSDVKVSTLMRHPLPDYPGKDGVLVSVEFGPGHVDAPHRHPGHVFGYVLEGSVEMQMEGGALHTLKPGDTFYENPKDAHPVGRNVSNTEQAKLLVFFVMDQNAPLVLPLEH